MLKFTIGAFLFFLICCYGPLPISANYISGLEQQINILDQEYQTISTTAVPTNNSLGLIQWDGNKYTGANVYFEAIIACVTCSGGNAQATAQLYTDTGTAVTSSAISTQSVSYDLVRTAVDITSDLSNGEEYSVRLVRDATSGTAYIKSARLIVIQANTNITTSQTQIEIGNVDTTTNTSYELLTGPKIYYYDADVYSGVSALKFEASLVNSDVSGTAYAALSSSPTCSSTVANSEITLVGTDWDRPQSNNLTLSDNTAYWVCLKSSSGTTTSIANAKIVMDQAEAAGIHKMQLSHLMINTEVTDTDDSYTNQVFPITFNPSLYTADVKEYYFESDLSISSGNGYARLFNISDSSTISNSELSTPDTAYARFRSGDLYWQMPIATKKLDSQLRNSSTNTTFSTSSQLIIQLFRITDPSLTFTISGVDANTVNNGITTSVGSDYHTLNFGNLSVLTPKYVAHSVYAATNADSGYIVTMKLYSYLQGLYPANNIDPFTSPWNNPTTWTEPTGTSPNDNTGWFGANTSDIRVDGWSSGTAKFGAVTNSNQIVMQSTGSDSGTTAFITYAIEINLLQPADQYTGSLVYNIIPIY